ncbi:hypothetical protein BTA51_05240 [Hahella sp. CCB-MM4]|uniref:hypothetical protein n=1 Tax=Hahella sp. (strain CCB-MM4) TaxID=1926491 RepID=UPI000B9AF5FA|nr:hypothetical protein [Hahella sp. CCB-MM4]OZG74414.1 hypothetical protein BTA51_05240 [Hahella sp. CCB-MM4]
MGLSFGGLNPFSAVSKVAESIGGIGKGNMFASIASGILDNALQMAGEKLGLPQSLIDTAQSAAHFAIGDIPGGIQNIGEVIEGLHQQSPFEAASSEHKCNDASIDLSGMMLEQGKGKGKDDKEGNWLIALARSLGEMVGQRAGEMLEKANDMHEINSRLDNMKAPGKGASDEAKAEYDQAMKDQAQDFMTANSEFQAQSQMFNIISQTTSNVIKTLGQGISNIAQKG